MNRREKYPDTDLFHFYNANPHGRFGGDCVVRAIATATDKPWEIVARALFENTLQYGFLPDDKHCYERLLKACGWEKHAQPQHADGTKWSVRDLIRHEGANHSKIIFTIAKHMSCIIDGKNWDIWDTTKYESKINNYWTK